MPCALVPDTRRIAVLRANALGDLMFVAPALEALKAAYPRAELVLLGAPWHVGFLAGRPGPVDRVEPVPPLPGIRKGDAAPGEREEWVQRMRAERFDIALQWHGGGRQSNPVVAGLGARVTSGPRTPDAERLDRWAPYVYFQHEVIRYFELARMVGVDAAPRDPVLAVTDEDRAEVARLGVATPFAVLHPGATDGRRRWPPEHFARVGDALAAEGLAVVVTGVEAEREIVSAVLAAMRGPARPLIDAVSLRGLTGLLSLAALVVSNDSGPLHLAHAVGARTVGIFWSFNLANAAPFQRARHRPLCSFCQVCPECGAGAQACEHLVSWVADVAPELVTAASLELLGRPVSDERALARALDPRAP